MNDLLKDPLFREFYKYIANSVQPEKKYVDQVKDLLRKDVSPDYIVAPDPGINVYRGISYVHKTKLMKMLGINSLPEESSSSVDFDGFIRPIGNSTVMSFSKSKQFVMNNFSSVGSLGHCSVIFTANTSDNPGMFLNIEGFYAELEMLGLESYPQEQEVLALGPIKISKIEWELAHTGTDYD